MRRPWIVLLRGIGKERGGRVVWFLEALLEVSQSGHYRKGWRRVESGQSRGKQGGREIKVGIVRITKYKQQTLEAVNEKMGQERKRKSWENCKSAPHKVQLKKVQQQKASSVPCLPPSDVGFHTGLGLRHCKHWLKRVVNVGIQKDKDIEFSSEQWKVRRCEETLWKCHIEVSTWRSCKGCYPV